MMTRRQQRQVFWRSFFVQAGWNFERMQNLGFSLCISPWLRRIYRRDEPAGRLAMKRHLGFFNTQPHMAGFILGVVGRMEEDAAREGLDPSARINTLKMAMSSSFAAMGDKFLWGTLKPLCAMMAAIAWLSHKTTSLPWSETLAAAAAAYLIVFNAPAIWLRWRGVRLGYEWGESIAVELKKFNWQDQIRRLRVAGIAVSSVVVFLAIFAPPVDMKVVLIRIAGLAGCVGIKMVRMTLLRIYFLIIAIGIAIAMGGFSV